MAETTTLVLTVEQNEKLIAKQQPLVQEILTEDIKPGTLIPLKTSLELRDDTSFVQAIITRTPVKTASSVISILRDLLPEGMAKGIPHLRRCAKPTDLPANLKIQFMNESPAARQIHATKTQWLYIFIGLESVVPRTEFVRRMARVDGTPEEIFIASIPVPALAPTSQAQAAMWSTQFWPCVYRKTNPLGPHPSLVTKNTEEIQDDAALWMAMAHQIANEGKAAGLGDPMGACIVQRQDGEVKLVAIAADARWQGALSVGTTGNPMAHSVMRAISMVAQKLVRAENRDTVPQDMAMDFEAFQDKPMLEDEQKVFDMPHPNPDGYLCHELEVYLTHEPCAMCSMAILHSRVGKVVFCKRMTLTGGMSAEVRGHNEAHLDKYGGGHGLGLFWRRELNWSLNAWEWEGQKCNHPHRVHAKTHA